RVQLPVEVIDRILQTLLEGSGRKFSSIAAFSLASHQFRVVAFRQYFSRVQLKKIRDINDILWFSKWFDCIRTLTITSSVLASKAIALHELHVTTMHISFALENFVTLTSRILVDLPQLPSTLKSLQLTSLPRISSALLKKIAKVCPELEELHLSVAERIDDSCCWGCLEESTTCITHSPLGDSRNSIEDLAVSPPSPLKQLKHLKHLSIGVLLSHETVLLSHINDHGAAEVPEDGDTLSSPSADISSAPETPASQQPAHSDEVVDGYSTPGIRTSLVGGGRPLHEDSCLPSSCPSCIQSHSIRVRNDEMTTSIKVAQVLRGLETIRWSSWFSSNCQEEDDASRYDGGNPRWTKLWILRKGGRIRVKRHPW
ncbi:hypothetical protein DENSPDRAFT_915585, partial [Dentipellis sp. KUC8613]